MKILSIHIFSLYQSKPIILSSAFALSFISIFQRGTLKEFLNFHSRLVIERIAQDTYSQIQLQKGICYAISNSDKIGVTMVCDEEYPKRVAIDFLFKIIENFKNFIIENKIDLNTYIVDTDVKYNNIKNEIEEWQDPTKKDNLMKLQDELNECVDIMRQNLNELIKREESLDSLIIKSQDLTESSKNFYKYAKKTNRCCNL